MWVKLKKFNVSLPHSTWVLCLFVFCFVSSTTTINIPTCLGWNHSGAQDELKLNMQINSKMFDLSLKCLI